MALVFPKSESVLVFQPHLLAELVCGRDDAGKVDAVFGVSFLSRSRTDGVFCDGKYAGRSSMGERFELQVVDVLVRAEIGSVRPERVSRRQFKVLCGRLVPVLSINVAHGSSHAQEGKDDTCEKDLQLHLGAFLE